MIYCHGAAAICYYLLVVSVPSAPLLFWGMTMATVLWWRRPDSTQAEKSKQQKHATCNANTHIIMQPAPSFKTKTPVPNSARYDGETSKGEAIPVGPGISLVPDPPLRLAPHGHHHVGPHPSPPLPRLRSQSESLHQSRRHTLGSHLRLVRYHPPPPQNRQRSRHGPAIGDQGFGNAAHGQERGERQVAVPRPGEGLHRSDQGGGRSTEPTRQRGQRVQLRGRPGAELQDQELRRSDEWQEGAFGMHVHAWCAVCWFLCMSASVDSHVPS